MCLNLPTENEGKWEGELKVSKTFPRTMQSNDHHIRLSLLFVT